MKLPLTISSSKQMYLLFIAIIVVCILFLMNNILMTSKRNSQWTPQVQIFDGVEMVLVPAGCFMMGSSDREIATLLRQYDMDIFRNQAPQTQVCFDVPFWIDKYPVTNAQFRQFDGVAADESYWTDDNRPRETITWFEARDFCLLRDARLPSEAEWEYAARGWDSLRYPWGNEWNPDNAVWSVWEGYEYPDDPNRQTADVGSKPNGVSWVGALDMAGNVWQWTNSLDEPYPYNPDDGRENTEVVGSRVARGGAWAYLLPYVQSSYRIGMGSYYTDMANAVGFRCARSSD